VSQESSSTSNGRTEGGRFAPGNTFAVGRGRPRREIEIGYLQAFVDGCDEDTLRRVVAKLAAQALAGSVSASRLLLTHAMPGKELKIELASDAEEYRVAGRTPLDGLRSMEEYIQTRVQQMREQKKGTK